MMQWWFEHDVRGFYPDDAVLREVLTSNSHSFQCDIYDKCWFDQVHALYNPVRFALLYALAQGFDRRMFTPHPATGVIAQHKFPYMTPPEFHLTTHTCIAHLHAEFMMKRRRHLSSPTASKLGRVLVEDLLAWRAFPRSPHPS